MRSKYYAACAAAGKQAKLTILNAKSALVKSKMFACMIFCLFFFTVTSNAQKATVDASGNFKIEKTSTQKYFSSEADVIAAFSLVNTGKTVEVSGKTYKVYKTKKGKFAYIYASSRGANAGKFTCKTFTV